MFKVDLSKIAPSYVKVKKASNEALARTHHINFLKAEDKFFKSTDKFEGYLQDWSLKAVPEFFKSLKHVGKMAYEKMRSFYYYSQK